MSFQTMSFLQVPDAISEHYLHTAGFNTTDPRM